MEIILVIHLNIGQKSIEEAEKYINKIKTSLNLSLNNKNITYFIVPVRKDDTRIECINPILLNKKEYDTKVSKILFDATTKLDEFFENELKKKKPKKS